jgi:trehalose synthase
MLQTVDVGPQSLDPYVEIVGRDKIEELRQLAKRLRGVRIAHINATSYGGGVSELLRSIVPLMRALDIEVDWKVIHGDEKFFTVTKAFHNALQGADYHLSPEARETFLAYSTRNALLLEEHYDCIVIHDPQPLAMRHFHGRDHAKWIWRCHIDTSQPNREVWNFLHSFIEDYDAAVFTMSDFVPPNMALRNVSIIPPAIDPLSPKNMPLPVDLARRILSWIGVDLARPLITQVSRFDPWKDPLGVIEAYRLVRESIPQLQLALVGSMALDDPEGWEIYHKIVEASKLDPDVHVFTNLTGVGNMEVNAFQRLSSVVLQKSIREGFGLVVSETLWKNTPVVAGKTGGLPLQMPVGVGGFLVSSVAEAAEKTLYLLQHPEEATPLALKGHQYVQQNFLLTRLLADELKLLASL